MSFVSKVIKIFNANCRYPFWDAYFNDSIGPNFQKHFAILGYRQQANTKGIDRIISLNGENDKL